MSRSHLFASSTTGSRPPSGSRTCRATMTAPATKRTTLAPSRGRTQKTRVHDHAIKSRVAQILKTLDVLCTAYTQRRTRNHYFPFSRESYERVMNALPQQKRASPCAPTHPPLHPPAAAPIGGFLRLQYMTVSVSLHNKEKRIMPYIVEISK